MSGFKIRFSLCARIVSAVLPPFSKFLDFPHVRYGVRLIPPLPLWYSSACPLSRYGECLLPADGVPNQNPIRFFSRALWCQYTPIPANVTALYKGVGEAPSPYGGRTKTMGYSLPKISPKTWQALPKAHLIPLCLKTKATSATPPIQKHCFLIPNLLYTYIVTKSTKGYCI